MAVNDIASNLRSLRAKIDFHARRCGRNPQRIELLAVSKTFSAQVIDQVVGAGQRLLGENRIQEAEEKIPQVQGGGLTWHLIGHLQSNKARKAVEIFDVIQTLDSEKILLKVGRWAEQLGKELRVYLQVNIGEEAQKHGISPDQVQSLVRRVDCAPSLELVGLMAIPPYQEDAEAVRPYFRRMRALLEEVNQRRERPLAGLSMGMSHDYPIAIEEGATLLRIGQAIFGERRR
ncbi:MAG: YggS family pyridoxal phosphate-dependent enzyme [Acidobacteriota bacterium]